jgi:hypothetical protein
MLYLIVHSFIFRRLAGTLALMSAAIIVQMPHLFSHVTLELQARIRWQKLRSAELAHASGSLLLVVHRCSRFEVSMLRSCLLSFVFF